MKLSRKQKRALKDIGKAPWPFSQELSGEEHDPGKVVKALIKKGLVIKIYEWWNEWEEEGGVYSLTHAGRAALDELPKGKE